MCLGIPGQIVDMTDVTTLHQAMVDVGGVRRKVHVGLLLDDKGPDGPLAMGDWVLVHVGFAMSKMDADEASRTMELIRELGDLYEQEIEQFKGTAVT